MKFSEAMQALKDGKKVSMPGWGHIYIKIRRDDHGGCIGSYNQVIDHFPWNLDTLMEDDWIVSGSQDPCSFEGVIYALRYGKTATKNNADWVGKYIKLDKDSGEVVLVSYEPFPFNPSFKDLLRDDWFVVEEK